MKHPKRYIMRIVLTFRPYVWALYCLWAITLVVSASPQDTMWINIIACLLFGAISWLIYDLDNKKDKNI